MTNIIEKSIHIKAPIERVWRALTDHAEFGAWFEVDIDGPFVVGQPSTGWMKPPNCDMEWNAVVKAMNPNDYFAYSWHPYAIDPKVDYSGETPTLVEFRLSPAEGGTRLTVTETGFDHVPAHRRAEAVKMHTQGWNIQAENIKRHVER